MNINNIHEEKNIKEININNIHGRRPSPPRVGFVLRFVVRGAVTHRGRRVLLWRCAVLHDGQRAPVIVGDPANPHFVRPWDGDVPLPPASSPPLPRSTASPPTRSGGGEGASAAAAITGGRRSLPSHRTWRRGGRSRHRRLHSRRIRRRGGRDCHRCRRRGLLPPAKSGGGEGAGAAAVITGGRRNLPSRQTWRRGWRGHCHPAAATRGREK